MLSRPLGAFLAALVTAAAGSAQFASDPDQPPPAAIPFDGGGVPADSGVTAGALLGGPEPYRWWLSGEYLLGFTRSADAPSVFSTSPPASAGISGLAGTQRLQSGTPNFSSQSGFRFGGGVWLDPCRAYGFEWSVFFLPQREGTSTFQAAPGQVLARPFFDTLFNVENSRVVSSPGLFSGSGESSYRTFFWGGELGSRVRVVETPTLALEQLFHFRYYALEESFDASDTSTALPGGVVAFNGQVFPAPATVRVSDSFEVLNRFYGGSAGLRLIWTPGRWEVRVDGRMGAGTMEQNVTLRGTTQLLNAGPNASTTPGFYTAAQSLGYSRNYKLSLAPDVQAKVGYRVTDWLMVSAGYQFLYMTNVARPGDLVDPRLSSARLPSSQTFGANAPAVRDQPVFVSSDFWMHGFTAGLMFTF